MLFFFCKNAFSIFKQSILIYIKHYASWMRAKIRYRHKCIFRRFEYFIPQHCKYQQLVLVVFAKNWLIRLNQYNQTNLCHSNIIQNFHHKFLVTGANWPSLHLLRYQHVHHCNKYAIKCLWFVVKLLIYAIVWGIIKNIDVKLNWFNL